MAGHGSEPDPDRSTDDRRQVGRNSGMQKLETEHGTIREYRPPTGTTGTSDRGTRYAWDVGGGAMAGGRGGDVRTLKRAKTSVKGAAARQALNKDRYSGRLMPGPT